MRRWLLGLTSLVAAGCAAGVTADDVLVVQGGWLIDGVGDAAVPNPGILIRNGTFDRVGVAPGEYDQFRVLELAEDEFVLPGIFDLHAHHNVNLVGGGRVDEAEVNPVIFLANGVTSTFPGGEYNPERMFAASERIARGEQIGARIFNSGPYFGSARRGWDANATAQDIHDDVDYWVGRGAAGFKAKGIGPEHLQALIERAHFHGVSVTGHLGTGAEGSVNPRDAVRMGIDRIEHFLGGDAFPADSPAYVSLSRFHPGMPEFDEITQLYIEHGAFFDATITAFGYGSSRREDLFSFWTDESRFFTPYVRELVANAPPRSSNALFDAVIEAKLPNIRAFHEAGGQITLGTDNPSRGEYLPGFSAHRELHAFVVAGIPPMDAIKIATINGARALRVDDRFGSIETGKVADLFVVGGNPLEDIRNTRNVRWVVKDGALHDAQQLLRSVEGRMGPTGPEEATAWAPAP